MPVADRADGDRPERAAARRPVGHQEVVVFGLLHRRRSASSFYASNTVMSSFVGGALVRALFGIGLGFTTAPATESIMGSLPPGRAGVGLGRSTTPPARPAARSASRCSAACSSRCTTTTRRRRASSRARRRAAVHDSVGTALSAARHLPAKQAAELVTFSRTRSSSAMRLTYPIAAAIVLVRRGDRVALPARARTGRVRIAGGAGRGARDRGFEIIGM